MKNNISTKDIKFDGENVDILRQLGNLFSPHRLYMVGGSVRDVFLGSKEVGDIDIASTLSVSELKGRITGTEFKLVGTIENTGTAIIKYKEHTYEYTRFRKDLYRNGSGEHKPKEVVFVDDIKIDAERRDFKANAIYRDVVSGEIVDPLEGLADVHSRILSTTRDPNSVFEEDGLRLLRLARFAGQLQFEIDKITLSKAKENVWRIKDIASERIYDELSRMLALGGERTVRAFGVLFEIGLHEYVLDGSTNKEDIKYLTFNGMDEVSRWSVLFKNAQSKERIISYFKNMGASKKIATQVSRVCSIYDKQPSSKAELMKFVIENQDVMDSLIVFQKAVKMRQQAKELEDILIEMRDEKVPMSIKELPVNGQDLIDLGIPNIIRRRVLEDLLTAICGDFRLRDRDLAMTYIKNRYIKEKQD